jgi:hypothetical protein
MNQNNEHQTKNFSKKKNESRYKKLQKKLRFRHLLGSVSPRFLCPLGRHAEETINVRRWPWPIRGKGLCWWVLVVLIGGFPTKKEWKSQVNL